MDRYRRVVWDFQRISFGLWLDMRDEILKKIGLRGIYKDVDGFRCFV